MTIQSNFTTTIEDTNDERVKRVFIDPYPLKRRKLCVGLVVDGTLHFTNITPAVHGLPLTRRQMDAVYTQVQEILRGTDGQSINLGS